MKELKRRLEDLFESSRDFIRDIKEGEKVCLIYDSDADGIASAALILFVLEKMNKRIEKAVPSAWGKIKKLRRELKNFDRVIMVDMPVDLIEKYLLDAKKKMLIIDHHPGRDLNSENIVLVNPRLKNPKIYQPTSYVVYKMFSNFLREKKWIAVLGTVGDFGIEDCKDLVKIKNKRNVWKSKFGGAAMLLTSSLSIYGAGKTLKFLMNSKDLEDFVESREIVSASEKFRKEFERCEKEFKKNLEIHGIVLITRIKPKYKGICSALITKFATRNPHKIVFVFEEGEEIKIHGRCGSKEIDVGRLFRKLGIGGGHEAAGAGKLNKKEENKIKKRILKELRDFIR